MPKEIGYGFFPGGDPRSFVPEEGTPAAEVEAWRAACAAAQQQELHEEDAQHEPACLPVPGLGFVTRGLFGLGTYIMEVED